MRAIPTATVTASGKPSLPGWPRRPDCRSSFAISRRRPRSGTRSSTGLFSHITMNWRGRPLTSHEVVVQCIAATTTRSGLRVEAELDRGAYPLGLAVSRTELQGLPIEPHAQRGAWNYTVVRHEAPPNRTGVK